MPQSLDIYGFNGTPGMSTANINSLLARIARLEDMAPARLRGNKFAAQGFNKFSPLMSDAVSGGRLDLSSADGLDFKGIMAPNVVDGQFSVACPSDSTATIYWDGTNLSRVILIRRADQTATVVPPGSISVSGLTASASYQAFAFWVPFNACGIGFSPGDTGTPLIAFSSTATATTLNQAQWNASLAGREPLGNFKWTQPAGGGSSGGATPIDPPVRNPGTCVMTNTDIEPLMQIAPDDWGVKIFPQQEWLRIETHSRRHINCTPGHSLYDAELGKIKAEELTTDSYAITQAGEDRITLVDKFIRNCTKRQVWMRHGHLFWANGFLSHNIKLPEN